YGASTGPELSLNTWYHLAGVFDGRSVQLFLNGVLKSSKEASGPITQYPGDLNLGRNSYWQDRIFEGEIAEVRLWNKARTPGEIQRDLYKRMTGNEPDLAAYWKLDEGAGETARDAAKSQNNGVIKGAEWVESDSPLTGAGIAEIDPKEQIKALRNERDDLSGQLTEARASAEGLQKQNTTFDEKIKALEKQNSDLE
ncbi:MAG: hypothetical protein GY849_21445, partial [Deltaproteobacteria bacterium]|nr:hypothetical protein [Deltaproteobacteria bacterium]